MKKTLVASAILIAFSLSAIAQKGDNKIGIGGEFAVPVGSVFKQEVNSGFGGWIKFLFGAGKADRISFSSGYTSFSAKGSNSQESATLSILPFLFGFQHVVVSGLYLEPQVGLASYRAKYTSGGQSISGSKNAFTYAVGIGYQISDIDFGLRYQNGTIEGYNYANMAFRVGYNFSLKKK